MENVTDNNHIQTISLLNLKRKLQDVYQIQKRFTILKSKLLSRVSDNYDQIYNKTKNPFRIVKSCFFEQNHVLSDFAYISEDNQYVVISFLFSKKDTYLVIKKHITTGRVDVNTNLDKEVLNDTDFLVSEIFALLTKRYAEMFMFGTELKEEQSFYIDNCKASFFTDNYGTRIILNSVSKISSSYVIDNQDEILSMMNVPVDSLNRCYKRLFKSENK